MPEDGMHGARQTTQGAWHTAHGTGHKAQDARRMAQGE
jgi:hypothetical protein